MRSESERIPYSRFSSDDYQTMNTSAYILITRGARGTHVYSCTQHSRQSIVTHYRYSARSAAGTCMHTPAKKLASCSHLEVLLIGLFRVRVRVPLNGLLLGTGLLQLGAQM